MEDKFHDLVGISPEKAQKILKQNGVETTKEEAKKILELLIFLVNLSMDQILDH